MLFVDLDYLFKIICTIVYITLRQSSHYCICIKFPCVEVNVIIIEYNYIIYLQY